MKTIWKYTLEVGANYISMPEGALVLTAHEQYNYICIWALVDPDAKPVRRTFDVVGTNNPVYDHPRESREYIGTVLDDRFVWHVFEVKAL